VDITLFDFFFGGEECEKSWYCRPPSLNVKWKVDSLFIFGHGMITGFVHVLSQAPLIPYVTHSISAGNSGSV